MREIAILMLLAGVMPAQTPFARVREERKIVIDGVEETWRLVWTAPPRPMCASASDWFTTCPCHGFAFGETGHASLLRYLGGVEVERMPLGPLFDEDSPTEGVPTIPRRPFNWKTDSEKSVSRKGGWEEIERRPAVRIMEFADYDHDGRATEFYLQTSAIACGWQFGVVIGVSRANSRLHVFTAGGNPATPLRLRYPLWETIREAPGPVETTEWTCGDHGSETQSQLSLSWTPQGITGTRREYSCPPGPRRLLSEAPLGSNQE
ncbi:MAG: hypothetical protein J0L64_10690 [Acidobacteria bacterium]|nr:hypothetical protein [Acidobacteriota bacterium]